MAGMYSRSKVRLCVADCRLAAAMIVFADIERFSAELHASEMIDSNKSKRISLTAALVGSDSSCLISLLTRSGRADNEHISAELQASEIIDSSKSERNSLTAAFVGSDKLGVGVSFSLLSLLTKSGRAENDLLFGNRPHLRDNALRQAIFVGLKVYRFTDV